MVALPQTLHALDIVFIDLFHIFELFFELVFLCLHLNFLLVILLLYLSFFLFVYAVHPSQFVNLLQKGVNATFLFDDLRLLFAVNFIPHNVELVVTG